VHRAIRLALLILPASTACRGEADRRHAAADPTATAGAEVVMPTTKPTPSTLPSSNGVASAAPAPPCPNGYRCGAAVPPDAVIDLILIEKSEHRLSLVSGSDVAAMYSVALGSGGPGQKHYEGDKTTPMGAYSVTAIIKNTRWHTYLALDYPNEEDKKRYEALVARGEAPAGVGAGSGIAIHGRRKDMRDGLHKLIDWTLGCVALDND
jgi:hypothetical protein